MEVCVAKLHLYYTSQSRKKQYIFHNYIGFLVHLPAASSVCCGVLALESYTGSQFLCVFSDLLIYSSYRKNTANLKITAGHKYNQTR
nr:MAG TPA: hypothetical protein [Caudoviricetes sp.]